MVVVVVVVQSGGGGGGAEWWWCARATYPRNWRLLSGSRFQLPCDRTRLSSSLSLSLSLHYEGSTLILMLIVLREPFIYVLAEFVR